MESRGKFWAPGARSRHVICRALIPALVSSLAVAATAPPASAHRQRVAPPESQGHAYRQGVVPLRGHRAAGASTSASTNDLSYGGGIGGVGVTTGTPQVYLVFWGSQWGTPSYNSNGTVGSLSGDPNGMAPYVERFVEGLGTGSDANVSGASTWSGVMSQYCQSSATVTVATGSVTCPSGASLVGYPGGQADGGALAGVWVDTSSSAPSQANGNQIGQEAVKAATHFGNTTQASNRDTEYVIVSPTGTHPDGFNTFFGQFCAWHDYTGDTTLSGGGVSSADGQLAFTNLPYVPDAGGSCGANFVNSGSAGALDGVSIVEGHEYAETLTDQFPAGGWTDSAGNETGDKCAWISSGQGASQDITLGTGTFAVQSTWANDSGGGSGGCEISHPIESSSPSGGGTTNTVTVTNPGNQAGTVGTAESLQIHASDSASGQTLSYSAAGLPAGLSINSSSGLISGTPAASGSSSVTVTATDSTGASGSATFTWTINSAGGSGGCTAKQLLGNPGFETGTAAPWTATAGVIQPSSAGEPAHSGNYLAWLDGYNSRHTDTLAQKVALPSGCSNYTFSFWLHVDTARTTTTTAYDTLKVQVLNSTGAVVATLATYSNLDAASGYTQRSFSVAQYAGQTVTLKFTGVQTSSRPTSFVVDDTAVNVS